MCIPINGTMIGIVPKQNDYYNNTQTKTVYHKKCIKQFKLHDCLYSLLKIKNDPNTYQISPNVINIKLYICIYSCNTHTHTHP